jgi:tRNA-splicing ligase RtcB (3'-phosphate/5'-hydroxy nucleic acid ligase)
MMNSPISKDANVQIMPDCHAGAGCVIGTTMKIVDKVCPNVVGVDIGCGVLVMSIGKIDIDLEALDNFIKEKIPHGFGIDSKIDDNAEVLFNKLHCKEDLSNKERALKSLGSLGGGNHFIEVDVDDEGFKYLLIHSGSRNLGLHIAKYYQNQASLDLKKKESEETNKIIKDMKDKGDHKEIQKLMDNRAYKREWPEGLDYVEGDLLDKYLHDMEIAQLYAKMNRDKIGARICAFLKTPGIRYFDTVHNYIDVQSMILRKGAVSAELNELLIIPINMRDGALICRGKGNPDWNCSAPHGAGRLLSRSEAKKTLSESNFAEQMVGIFTTTADINTLDESPMAYKPMQEIIDNIGDTVEIVKIIRPIYNFKASE